MKKTASYRLRGFKCQACSQVTQVFGNDPEPTRCLHCLKEGTLAKEFDEKVTSVTTVEPYLG